MHSNDKMILSACLHICTLVIGQFNYFYMLLTVFGIDIV